MGKRRRDDRGAANPPDPGRSRLEAARLPILAALLVIAFLQAFSSMRGSSVTWDEIAFVPAGYSYVATGDFRLNREQPPLMKLLFGLPCPFLRPEVPTDHPSWTSVEEDFANTQWEFGRHFLSTANDDGPTLVFWSRVPVVLLTVLLVFVVYAFARDLYGTAAGLLAAGLCAVSPNVIGHGGLATTDLGVTLFAFLAVLAFRRYLLAPGLLRGAAAAGALALALLAKFSGVLLLPLYPIWALVRAIRRPEASPATRRGKPRKPAGGRSRPRISREVLRRLLPGTAGIVGGALLLTSFAYLAPGRVDRYFRDMLEVGANVNPNALNYLLGEFSRERFPHYFLVAFLVKTPLWTLLLVAARFLLDPLHRRDRPLDLLMLGLPVILFFGVISWRAEQIGVRYLLPVYPFLFVYASGIVRHPKVRGTGGRVALAALGIFAAVSTVRVHPHQLSYFNELAGGPAGGIRVLEHSNVDWGQELARLAKHLDENGIERVRLLYSKNSLPSMYGIDAEPLDDPEAFVRGDPGYYVIGVKEGNRARVRREDGSVVSFLELREPGARIGAALYLYDLRDEPDTP